MNQNYDKNNIFFKILNGKIPCDKVFESDHSLAFRDINPRAKVHVLVIPKRNYINLDDFILYAETSEKIDIFDCISEVVKKEKLMYDGYRVLTNVGEDGHQEVQHLHFHILGGQSLGGFIKKLSIT
jgi:histidine triad (HIT) family protein